MLEDPEDATSRLLECLGQADVDFTKDKLRLV